MNFPWSRHFQRYEYLIEKGWTKDKVVLDIGAGSGFGSLFLTTEAKMVYAVDPELRKANNKIREGSKMFVSMPMVSYARPERRMLADSTLEEVMEKLRDVDICVCIEVIEHQKDVDKFVRDVAKVAEWAFFTTPLAKKTGKTRNKEHVREYSKEGFREVLEKKFHVRDLAYQYATLEIVGETAVGVESRGDSFDTNHVVQMAWCERKGRG